MQRRSFSHKRVDSFHSFNAAKTKSAPLKNEWGENFIMDRCGLPCVPSLKGRENVQFISLQHNLICRIDSLSSFRMLKVLNLYDNKIERISGLDTLASLRVLMLGKNRLKTTEGLESLQSLDILDLHGNQIAALTGMSRLRTLRVLNLAANSLKKLPSLDGLLALEELNAKRNRICKIVPEVAHAKRLERLYLSNNELRRLDDLSPLGLLNGLKELSLDGNPLTFNANYVLYAVSSMPSLVLLDQNVISCGLRGEAENWSSQRLPASTASSQMDKVNPIVTVQHKASASSGVAIGAIKSSGMSSKFHQRNVAVVRPMSTTNQPEQEQHEPPPHPEGLTAQVGSPPIVNDPPPRCSTQGPTASAIKSCLVRSGDHPRRKSFRQIAFSAMVCNAAAPRPADDSQDKSSQPVFRFSLRPPTAEWNETIEQRTTGKRINSSGNCSRRRDRSRVAIEFDDSSSSWNSDSDDSDTASTASNQSRKPAARLACRVSTAPTSSSTAMNLTRSLSSSANKFGPTSLANQKLSATIGMNIKEQLRDLRIIVGEEEVHITGINIVRMLQNMQWSPDEVELFHMVVFYGLSFDQLCPHYASLRKLFPNLRNFAFRKMAIPPTLRQINGLAKLESPSWFRWSVSVETLVPTPEPLRAAWRLYAIYRLHPFGLDQIDGEPIGPEDVANAEDHYDTLDALVLLTAPSTAIRRQFDRFYDAGQTSSSSSSGSSDVGGAACQQQQQSRDNEYNLLMRKRAIRATFQPFKETKHLRNRTAHLKYIAEYGMEVAVKLSFLSQNWERLFSGMVETAADEVQDEAVYKRTKMAQMRSNTNA